MTACRVYGCAEVVHARWYGWNAAKPGDPPRNVKAPLCSFHVHELRKKTPVIVLERRSAP